MFEDKDFTIISYSNYEQYLGLNVVAFIDDLSYSIDMVDRDGKLYRTENISYENLKRILPCLGKKCENKEALEEESYYCSAIEPFEGWFYVDLRYVARCFMWYTKEMAKMAIRNEDYLSELYNDEDMAEELVDNPLFEIFKILEHDKAKEQNA